MKIVLILAILTFVCNMETAGSVGTKIYDFKNVNLVDFAFLASEEDLHPNTINREGIQDFVYKIGDHTKTNCSQKAIACIKYLGDPEYYAVTSEEKIFKNSTISHVTSFDELGSSFTLKLSKSSEKIGPGGNKREVQFLMKFKCSSFNKTESSLSEIEPFTYLLEILSSDLCPQRFNYIAHAIHVLRYIIGPVLILCNIFLIIPNLKLYEERENEQKLIENGNLVLLWIQLLILIYLPISVAIYNYLSMRILFKIILMLASFVVAFFLLIIIFINLVAKFKLFIQYFLILFSITIYLLIYNFILIPFVPEHQKLKTPLNYMLLFSIILILFSKLITSTRIITVGEILKSFFHIYMLVRGIGFLFGGYPDEFLNELMKETHLAFPKLGYLYLLILIFIYSFLLFIYAIYFCCNKSKNKDFLIKSNLKRIASLIQTSVGEIGQKVSKLRTQGFNASIHKSNVPPKAKKA